MNNKVNYNDMSRDELLQQVKDFEETVRGMEGKLVEKVRRLREKDKRVKDLEAMLVVETLSSIKNNVCGQRKDLSFNEIMVMTRAYTNALQEAFEKGTTFTEGYKDVERAVYNADDTERVTYEYAKQFFDDKIESYNKTLERNRQAKDKNKAGISELEEILNKIM